MTLLSAADSQLVIVDIQEKLAPAIHDGEAALEATLLLVAAAKRLGVPISVTEQYPKGLGASVAPLRAALPNDAAVLEKMHFSAMREPAIADHLATHKRRSMIMCGMEAHVCVLQTALDAKAAGYDVYLVRDGVGSRKPLSVETALRRMEHAGIHLVTSEMVVFEWMERAGTDDFKAIAPLLK